MRAMSATVAAALALIATPAPAADLGPAPVPYTAPAAAAAPTAPLARSPLACHVHALAGAAVDTLAANDGADRLTVAIAGHSLAGGIGCDWRWSRYVVVGALARYELRDVADADVKADRAWAVALRAGSMINAGVLAYGLVGLAGMEVRAGDARQDGRGLLLGAGLEISIDNRWGLVAEYNWSSTGRWHADGVSIDPASHVARVGITYYLTGR